MSFSALASYLLASVLVWSTIAKIKQPANSSAAFATFGISRPLMRWLSWALTVIIELLLAAGVALQSDFATYAAATFVGFLAAVLTAAMLTGRSGKPCACFGSKSKVGWVGVTRNLLLAAGFAALPSLPNGAGTNTQWVTVGLLVALAGTLGLAVAVAALAREVGMLRLALGPQAALEIPDEGPPLGLPAKSIEAAFSGSGSSELALAVFSSEGCHMCQALQPAVEALASSGSVPVAVFDEYRDRAVWSQLSIPGSPYAVAVASSDTTVLAKGTFNTPGQLEGLLATAERRLAAQKHS